MSPKFLLLGCNIQLIFAADFNPYTSIHLCHYGLAPSVSATARPTRKSVFYIKTHASLPIPGYRPLTDHHTRNHNTAETGGIDSTIPVSASNTHPTPPSLLLFYCLTWDSLSQRHSNTDWMTASAHSGRGVANGRRRRVYGLISQLTWLERYC